MRCFSIAWIAVAAALHIKSETSSSDSSVSGDDEFGDFFDIENEESKSDEKFKELYQRGKSLGRGAYGEVFAATEKATGAERAVKLITKHSLLAETRKDHFFRRQFVPVVLPSEPEEV